MTLLALYALYALQAILFLMCVLWLLRVQSALDDASERVKFLERRVGELEKKP